MNTLNHLRGRRVWFVPDFIVWGTPSGLSLTLASVESINGQLNVSYSAVTIGGSEQTALFSNLIDHRGNHLPQTIRQPKALLAPKSSEQTFLVGREFETGFKVAREDAGPGPAIVDLLIMELG
ncbi:MAG: hypothetical protein ACE5GA_00970 [Candidatus Zixiibacteriota bacterium]